MNFSPGIEKVFKSSFWGKIISKPGRVDRYPSVLRKGKNTKMVFPLKASANKDNTSLAIAKRSMLAGMQIMTF